MKPTVINNSSESSHPVHHGQSLPSQQQQQQQQQQQHQNMDNMTNNGQNPTTNDHSRRFRQHGFGFNDPDDDVFANMGLRSRLNRMSNPFEWSARKRQNANDPYDHYFHDDVDFPHFGSTWDAFNRMGNKRSQHPSESNDRSGFFDYLPPEFRQYMPDHFGHFNSARHPGQNQNGAPQTTHPQHQTSSAQQSNSKSNLCDAAIQTDDLTSNQSAECDASNTNNNSANSATTSGPNDRPGAYQQQSSQTHGRQYQQHPYGQQYQPQQQSVPTQHSSSQPNAQSHQGIRNVPIFIEGTNVPVSRSDEDVPQATSTTSSNKSRPEPLNKESFPSNEPIPAQAPSNISSQSNHQTQHSEEVDSNDPNAPPQTPHTADCISKIQAIQRDVLQLMCAVEQFGGKRGDKEYMYLDEMLTRNLLKLDTIDTNGKESIRLARKEAIKCIQASIAVLEAKSDLHLNEKKDANETDVKNAVDVEKEPTNKTEATQATELTVAKSSAEKMDIAEEKSAPSNSTNCEIPQVQQNVENISIEDNRKASEPLSKPENETKSETLNPNDK